MSVDGVAPLAVERQGRGRAFNVLYGVTECLCTASPLFRPLAVFPVLAAEKTLNICTDVLVGQSGPVQLL